MRRHENTPFLNTTLVFGALFLAGSLLGCDALNAPSGADEEKPPTESISTVQEAVHSDLVVTLRAPDTVRLGSAFDVRIQLDNRSDQTKTVTTGNVALWDFGIYDGSEVVPVEGSMQGYATVVTDHQIDPGTSTSTLDLRAVRSSNRERPISPGTYTGRLTVNWWLDDTNVKDTLRTTMVFRGE